jgi:CHAT domain
MATAFSSAGGVGVPNFQFLVIGFSAADAAERVARTLGERAHALDAIHVTHIGPRTQRGSRWVSLLGAEADPTDARPGALIAGILDAEPGEVSDLGDAWGLYRWEPREWQSPDYNVVQSPSDLPEDLGSALVFRFATDRGADTLASRLWSSFQSEDIAEPEVVTSFGLEQPAAVTAETIKSELASVTGQAFDVLPQGGEAFEIAPKSNDETTGVLAINGPSGPTVPTDLQRAEATSARVERYIDGRCPQRVKVDQPFWIAVQIAIHKPKQGNALPIDLPATGTRVHAMLRTSKDVALESEPDLELVVPPDRDSGWHAWRVRPRVSGPHQAVACFHHNGEVLAALAFDFRAGQSSGTDEGSYTKAVDLRSVALRQGLLVVRRDERMLRFIALDGARQGEGMTAVAQKPLGPKDLKRLRQQERELDVISRASYQGRSRAEDAARVRSIGIDLLEFLPGEIRDFLSQGVNRWESLKIETDDESLPWELLSEHEEGPESFFANRLPFLRWRSGIVPPSQHVAFDKAILVPGQPLGPADADGENFEQQVEWLRGRLLAPPEATVRSTGELARRILEANFELLYYCGHMTREGDLPSMHVGNDLFSVDRIRSLKPDALTRRPLVFLNACATNAKISRLTGPAGWVEDFLRAGAGAFIGTNWTVRASIAARFAERFYDALLGSDRNSLATASALARQETARQEDDWASLAYTIYGHPQAKVSSPALGDGHV